MEYDINKIVSKIIDKDKISISYIQRTFSFGFAKAGKIYQELVEKDCMLKK
jgi:DNA segregation ATPase FtsK/SpoIIIE-like protein